ncbi:MAG: magnesium and cobalt transport protein CorA [Corynebacterium sp.]|uniref:magnesium and cobalt transport protein CorA n=1 Tax=Corynebacterium sp. TaxID=1720 RepID=UPI0026E047FF|nr:magnesium and cobalt transport protein CorA [Corynebacterium sp.]MDO5670579.1 magnesium and cobalt transport protein CorA [Corynebacterium sp.]
MLTPFERPRRATDRPRLTVPVERAIDHCRVFTDGVRRPGEYIPSSALNEVREHGSGFVWLGLREPDARQMERVAEQFGIHPLIVEDAVTAHQRPKVERYDDQLFMVVRSVKFRAEASETREIISTGEVQMLIGPDFIITVRHGAELPELSSAFEDNPELIALGPAALAWRVADHLVDEYGRIAGLLEQEVDDLEEEVFTPGSRFNIEQIYMYKREILEMRHSTDPLAPALRALITDNRDMLGKQLRSYFRDVLDHEMLVRDQIAGYDERLSALIDASVAKITMQQNTDMRTISAVVGMAAAPTLIAGIYGMNFTNMPELEWEYGYFLVLGVIALIVALMFWWFRRNNWL